MNCEQDDFLPPVPSIASNGTLRANGIEPIAKTLNDFGLGEKEAKLYVHLLKYGPKGAGDLAKSLKTYRLEIYRKLTSLVDKNMVTVKKESPAVYSAVDLEKALNAVLLARQRELHRIEKIKPKLLERADGTRLSLQHDTVQSEKLAIDDDRTIIQLLTAFGLAEKEATLYVHLLKYGPKGAGDLAKSLKTYREDVYRRCARLVDVGLATKTSEHSSRYGPVELDDALNNVLLTQKRELRHLQRVKHTLSEDTITTLWRRENVNSSFKLVKTVGELVTTISYLINSAETSIFLVAHPQFSLFSMGGFQEHLRCAVARGVTVRGVLDIYQKNSLVAREYLNRGVELRHKENYCGMTMVIADCKRSISLIYPYLKTALSLDEKVAALRSDSIAQAEFLTSIFEMTWTQAISAEQHISQQLQQVPRYKAFHESADKMLSTYGNTAAPQHSLTRN